MSSDADRSEPAAGRAQPVVRAAASADAAEVARLLEALSRHEEDLVQYVTPEIAQRDFCGPSAVMRTLVVAREDPGAPQRPAALRGIATWQPHYETTYAVRGAYVSDLFVDEDQRGRGIGRALLAAVSREVAVRGGVFLWLTARGANTAARAFYRQVCDVEEENLAAYALTRERFAALSRGG